MATRPPAGPIGNSPRDVRDDAIGAPPDVIKAGEALKKTRKPVRVKSNTFHAKVSGNTPPKRADRAPTFRRGGWVSGYASGGFVAKPRAPEVKEHRERSGKAKIADAIEDKREDMPGVQKNDTSSDQNLRGKPVKFEDKPVFTPSTLKHKAKLADGGAIKPIDSKPPGVPGDRGGVKKKYADGGEISDLFSNASKARQRSESTEFARASSDIDKAARKPTAIGRAIFPEEMELRAAKRAPFEKKMEATGPYKRGGKV